MPLMNRFIAEAMRPGVSVGGLCVALLLAAVSASADRYERTRISGERIFLVAAIDGRLPAAPSSVAQAASAALEGFAEMDRLYLHRHQGDNLNGCLATLRGSVARLPEKGASLWRLGRALVAAAARRPDKDGKLALLKESETFLRQAIVLRADDIEAHYWLAMALGAISDVKQSLSIARQMEAELKTVIRLDGRHGGAHHALGDFLRRLPAFFGGDKKKAVRELAQALRLTPNDTSHYPALAQAYVDVKDVPKALAVLRKAADVTTPDDPASYGEDMQRVRALLLRLEGRQ